MLLSNATLQPANHTLLFAGLSADISYFSLSFYPLQGGVVPLNFGPDTRYGFMKDLPTLISKLGDLANYNMESDIVLRTISTVYIQALPPPKSS
jgi:hypothetical protein